MNVYNKLRGLAKVMGEKEQSGMLRTVIVLGLIALIASVILGVTLLLNHKMNVLGTNTVNAVDRTGKEYNTGLEITKNFKTYDMGAWGGGHFVRMPEVGNIPPNHWREYRFDVKSSVAMPVKVDINGYLDDGKTDHSLSDHGTQVHHTDQDDLAKRSIVATNMETKKVYNYEDTGKAIVPDWSMTPDVWYHFDVKMYNSSKLPLLDNWPKETSIDTHSAIVFFTNNTLTPHDVTVRNFEAATYADDIE